jgi:hypothetical protein
MMVSCVPFKVHDSQGYGFCSALSVNISTVKRPAVDFVLQLRVTGLTPPLFMMSALSAGDTKIGALESEVTMPAASISLVLMLVLQELAKKNQEKSDNAKARWRMMSTVLCRRYKSITICVEHVDARGPIRAIMQPVCRRGARFAAAGLLTH